MARPTVLPLLLVSFICNLFFTLHSLRNSSVELTSEEFENYLTTKTNTSEEITSHRLSKLDRKIFRQIEELGLHNVTSPVCYMIGPRKFLSTAVHFCDEETRKGEIDVVSVGSGDGSLEKAIIAAYRQHYGNSSKLNVILVDPDPRLSLIHI